MPDIVTSIEHLADLDLYKVEKPYNVVLSPEQWDASLPPRSNLKFERKDNIIVTDIRGQSGNYTLDTAGFTIANHTSNVLRLETKDDLLGYKNETEVFLTKWFEAERVVCWDVKLRANRTTLPSVFDMTDWTIPQLPAQGAHNDVTFGSGPTQISRHLPDELKPIYLAGGYRFRIVNTWRSLNPVLEDNPLAVCDFRSLDKEDFIACDRVIPTHAGEVYYLRYNPQQKWCWLEHMTPDEPLLFVLYDSAPGPQARYAYEAPV